MQPTRREIIIHTIFLLIILLFAELFLTLIPINISPINFIFRQIAYSSNHLEVSKYLAYLTILIVILHCFHPKRISRNFDLRNFTQISIWLSIATALYILSGNTSLPGFYDYENFCTGNSLKIINLHKDDGTFGYQFFLTMVDLNRLITLKSVYENILPIPKDEFCLFPGVIERLLYLFLFFILPSLLYLNYFTKYLHKKIKITRDFSVANLDISEIVLCVLFGIYVIFHLILFIFDSWIRLLGYIALYAGMITFIFCFTKYYMRGYHFVIDKYFLCYFICPLACIRSGFDCIVFSLIVTTLLIEKKNKRKWFSFWEKETKNENQNNCY